jgi:hypothetical protein
MKKLGKIFGIITLAALIGFSMAACKSDTADDSSGTGTGTTTTTSTPTSNALGATLSLSGQVFTVDFDGESLKFDEFTGNREVFSYQAIGGEGNITDGHLSFSIGEPKKLVSIKNLLSDLAGANYLKVSPTTAQYNALNLRIPNGYLERENYSYTETTDSVTWMEEFVSYYYVDRNVNISAERTAWEDKDGDYRWSEIINAFNISLVTGWNAVRYRMEGTETENYGSYTLTISSSTPDTLRWILEESGGSQQQSMSLPAQNSRLSTILMSIRDIN